MAGWAPERQQIRPALLSKLLVSGGSWIHKQRGDPQVTGIAAEQGNVRGRRGRTEPVNPPPPNPLTDSLSESEVVSDATEQTLD